MPSARLVFNDDATVLGPVLESAGRMVQAATSDIPRIRMQREQQAFANKLATDRFGHEQSMDTANLGMRRDAVQAAADNQTLGLLTMGGGGGITSGRTRSGASGAGAASLGRLELAGEKQDEGEYQNAIKNIRGRIAEAEQAYPTDIYTDHPEKPGEKVKRGLTAEEAKTRMDKVRLDAFRQITEGDLTPAMARALRAEGFPLEGDFGREPASASTDEDGGAPAVRSRGLLRMQPDVDPMLLQAKRAAWVKLKGDPAARQRMGFDDNRMNESYRLLWPEDKGAAAGSVTPAQQPPISVSVTDPYTESEAPAPRMESYDSPEDIGQQIPQEVGPTPDRVNATIATLNAKIAETAQNIADLTARGMNTVAERAKLARLQLAAYRVPVEIRHLVQEPNNMAIPPDAAGLLQQDFAGRGLAPQGAMPPSSNSQQVNDFLTMMAKPRRNEILSTIPLWNQ